MVSSIQMQDLDAGILMILFPPTPIFLFKVNMCWVSTTAATMVHMLPHSPVPRPPGPWTEPYVPPRPKRTA